MGLARHKGVKAILQFWTETQLLVFEVFLDLDQVDGKFLHEVREIYRCNFHELVLGECSNVSQTNVVVGLVVELFLSVPVTPRGLPLVEVSKQIE